VVEVDHYVDLGGKVKFKGGTVVHTGDQASATQYIHASKPGSIIGLKALGGNRSTLTGGYGSTLLFKTYDYSTGRYRRKMVEVGEDGIEANRPYRMNDAGLIVPA